MRNIVDALELGEVESLIEQIEESDDSAAKAEPFRALADNLAHAMLDESASRT